MVTITLARLLLRLEDLKLPRPMRKTTGETSETNYEWSYEMYVITAEA